MLLGCIRSFHLEVTGPFVFNVPLSCTKAFSGLHDIYGKNPHFGPGLQSGTQYSVKHKQPEMVNRARYAWAELQMVLTWSKWGVGLNYCSSNCGCTLESPGEPVNMEVPRSHPR